MDGATSTRTGAIAEGTPTGTGAGAGATSTGAGDMAGGKSPETKAVKMEALRIGPRRMNHARKCNGGKHMEGSTIKRRMEEPNPDSNNMDVPKRLSLIHI